MRISFKKHRKIDVSNVSLTGAITSVKNNTIIEFESSLERDFIFLLEYNTKVKKYFEQPIIINFYFEDKLKSYVPDFFVEFENGEKQLIEIKYKKDLKDALNLKKFEEAKAFCKQNNIDFKVLTEEDIRTDLLFNAKFLLYYSNPQLKINRVDIEILFKRLKVNERLIISDLINDCARRYERQAELIHVLWYMLARNFIYYDKNRKLTMNSLVWIKKE